MGETQNIAEMAKKVSEEIFEIFGWQRVGAEDVNWACENPAHAKETHPSDVVFWYEDPYEDLRVYVNVDLKSYAKDSIQKPAVAGAVSSLALAVECAETGASWRAKFAARDVNHRIDGMLFTYNHDAEYSSDFADLLRVIDRQNFALTKGRRIVIVGPREVLQLNTISTDMRLLRTRPKEALPPLEECEYFYPDLVISKARPQLKSAASIEMLTGPWIVLRTLSRERFFIWYRGTGADVDEFKYLIDYLFRYQVLNSTKSAAASVEVRLVDPDANAVANFERAKEEYGRLLFGFANDRLSVVRCGTVTQVVTRFSEIEIGMGQRG